MVFQHCTTASDKSERNKAGKAMRLGGVLCTWGGIWKVDENWSALARSNELSG